MFAATATTEERWKVVTSGGRSGRGDRLSDRRSFTLLLGTASFSSLSCGAFFMTAAAGSNDNNNKSTAAPPDIWSP